MVSIQTNAVDGKVGINVQSSALTNALDLVRRAAEKRQAWPILNNVCVTPGENRVALTCSDLRTWAECQIPASVGNCGPFTVDVRQFTAAVKRMKGEVHIEHDGSQAAVSNGNGCVKLFTLPAAEFRGLPKLDRRRLRHASGLLEAVNRVASAVSSDESRAVLTAVLITENECVACDGNRIHCVKHGIDLGTHWPDTLVYRHDLMRLVPEAELPQVRVASDGEMLHVLTETAHLVTNLIEGTFPNWRRVVEPEVTGEWLVRTAELNAALKQVRPVAMENAHRVTFERQGDTLQITASSFDTGEAEATVALSGSCGAFPERIAFHVDYLLDALQFFSDCEVVAIKGSDPKQAVRIELKEDAFAVIMPMQLPED